MIDKSQIKKMWVWNEDIPNPKTHKAYVLFKDDTGYCAVDTWLEEYFEKGEDFGTIYWKHAEKIQEKWRPFREGEMPAEYIGYLYRHKATHRIYKAGVYSYPALQDIGIQGVQLYLVAYRWVGNKDLFENFEVSKDGGKTWEPIGVKEE